MSDCRQTEIGAAIIKARAIDVVNDKTSGDIWYQLAVHKEAGEFSICFADGAFGVEGVFAFCSAEAPFVFAETRVVVGVDDSVPALRERDFAEGVAEAEAAKK